MIYYISDEQSAQKIFDSWKDTSSEDGGFDGVFYTNVKRDANWEYGISHCVGKTALVPPLMQDEYDKFFAPDLFAWWKWKWWKWAATSRPG